MLQEDILGNWEPVVSFGLRAFKDNSKSVGGYDTQAHCSGKDNSGDYVDGDDHKG